jgi:cation transport ATPase
MSTVDTHPAVCTVLDVPCRCCVARQPSVADDLARTREAADAAAARLQQVCRFNRSVSLGVVDAVTMATDARMAVNATALKQALAEDRERAEERARQDRERAREDGMRLQEQIARVEERAKEERRAAEERAKEERRAAEERAKEERRAAEERAKEERSAAEERAKERKAVEDQFRQRMTIAAVVIMLLALLALVIYALAPSSLAKAWIVACAVLAFLGSVAKFVGVFG